jgi:hypothetical protein
MSSSSDAFMRNPDRSCVNAPLEVFVTSGDEADEPPFPSEDARYYCDRCPVRPECLMYALDNGVDFGVWGGMSAYQRGLLRRKKERKRCPSCSSTDIVLENGSEICLACGVSWEVWN